MKRRPAKTRTRQPARKPIATETALTPDDPQAVAIDVGATSHWVVVPPEKCAESVREFGVFTAALYAIAAWLQECKVKNVSGRKSDLLDCQWLRQLHSYGLLAGRFSPSARSAAVARVSAPMPAAGAVCGQAYPAYAEGAATDECALG